MCVRQCIWELHWQNHGEPTDISHDALDLIGILSITHAHCPACVPQFNLSSPLDQEGLVHATTDLHDRHYGVVWLRHDLRCGAAR